MPKTVISNGKFPLKQAVYLIFAVCFLLDSGISAQAFNSGNAAAAWQSYKQQFYYVLNGNQGYFRNQQGVGDTTTTYELAYDIEAAVDAQDVTVVNNTMNGFIALYGTNPATWDIAEDDNMTFALIFAAAYQLTGNPTHLTMARNCFDTSYARAWDSANGGGLMRIVPGVKSAQVNGPGCIAAYLIYQSGGGSAYLTKAQAIYNWMVANVWNSSTGQVNATPGDTSNPLESDAGYFAGCSSLLGYPGNVTLAGNFVQNTWGTGMQGFGPGSQLGGVNGITLRWLAKAGYNTAYLQACCDRGLTCLNSSGLVGPDFDEVTPNTAAYSFDCTNLVAGLMCVPAGGNNPPGPNGYTWCASENGSFTFSQPMDVAFGVNSSFNYISAVSGTFTFNNAAFGDPAPGAVKGGFFKVSTSGNITGPAGYVWCANENGSFTFSQATDVAFGGGSSFAYRSGVTGSITFNNATFGDPAPGIAKAGYYNVNAPVISSANNATFTVGQAGSFTITATGVPTPTFTATGLPSWATLNSTTGVLSGTPTGISGAPYTLLVTAKNNYLPNATQTFTLNVQTAFDQWEGSYSINSGPTAMPFHDGVPNLLKYLYDINPSIPMNAADRTALPVPGLTTVGGNQYLTLTYRQNAGESGITINLQTSTDLQNWTTVSSSNPNYLTQNLGVDQTTGDPIVELGVKTAGISKKFIRLNVTMP